MEDLIKLRDEIDTIDDQIVSLFEQRMAVAERVAAFKRGVGKPVLDKEREKSKIQKVTEKTSNAFNRQAVESLFGQIMAVSRMLQYQRLASGRFPGGGYGDDAGDKGGLHRCSGGLCGGGDGRLLRRRNQRL